MATTPERVIAQETPFAGAIRRLLATIERSFPPSYRGVVRCTLVGGCAVHLYTGYRVSDDMDAKFDPGILLSETPVVTYEDAGGAAAVALDRNYTDILAMMHPDWQQDALPWENLGRLHVSVISPLDLAVSKVARFADNDRLDIIQLARAGLVSAGAFAARCAEAIDYYVGDLTFVRLNVAEATDLIRKCSPGTSPP